VTGAARGARALVAIDGLDGSGKSQLARALAAACEAEGEPPVTVLRIDDFRRALGALSPGADEGAVYYDRYYDFAAVEACLRRFLDGATAATVPRFDPAREVIDGELELRFEGSRVALVEGVFVLRAPLLAASPLIALQVTEAEARRRILARDLARGRAREVVEHRIDHRYFPAQRLYRAAFDPLRRADVLIDNESWEHPCLLRCEDARLPRAVAKALSRVVPS
jgi:uridine kinase